MKGRTRLGAAFFCGIPQADSISSKQSIEGCSNMLDEFLGGYKIGSAFGVPGREKGAKATPLKGWKGDATHPKAPAGGGGPGQMRFVFPFALVV
jgi:hypothetical protein